MQILMDSSVIIAVFTNSLDNKHLIYLGEILPGVASRLTPVHNLCW